MKKAILAVLVILVVAVAGLCALIATRPNEYKVTRSATMTASPDAVFAQINDFHKWDGWSPWARIDPAMKVTYSGPTAGKGASYAWVGNSDVGEGQMTIAESKPNELVKIDLEFVKPFASNSVTQFELKPDGNRTAVTWTMVGQHNFISKAMCLVMDMDKMIGPDFEKGLSQLKPLAESAAVHVDVN